METDPEELLPASGDDLRPISTAELVQSEDGAHAFVQRFWLYATSGPDTGTTFSSNGDRITLGTHASANVILHDSTVSRFHCEITPVEGLLMIRDLGSRNGTVPARGRRVIASGGSRPLRGGNHVLRVTQHACWAGAGERGIFEDRYLPT
jgi:hypothetical protein